MWFYYVNLLMHIFPTLDLLFAYGYATSIAIVYGFGSGYAFDDRLGTRTKTRFGTRSTHVVG